MRKAVGAVVAARMEELGLTAEQVSIAAGLHKTTVYRIVGGVGNRPRAVTLRKLARALRIPIKEMTDQIEAPGLEEHFEVGHPLADLLVTQFELLPSNSRHAGAVAAISAILDVEAGLGEGKSAPRPAARLLRGTGTVSSREVEAILRKLFHRIPRLLQRTAVREGVRALIVVPLLLGASPAGRVYRVAKDKRLQPTPSFFVKKELEKARREQ